MKPMGGVLMNIRTKVLLQGSIKYLRLTVGLWMVSGAHSELGVGQFEQLALKIANKNRVTIRNKATRKAM